MGVKIVGQEQPWTVPGPSGTVSVLGVVFSGGEPALDNGALHSRGEAERGIRFSPDPAARGRGAPVVNVWVAYPGAGLAERFVSAVSVELWVDRASGTGFKDLAEQVNRMSAAVRGRIDVPHLRATERLALARLLEAYAPRAWAASGELQAALCQDGNG